MKEKIKNKLFDKIWKKNLCIFIVVFSLILLGGIFVVTYISDTIDHEHIRSENIIIVDKIYENDSFDNRYLITGNNSNIYMIPNNNDGKSMFDGIEIGHEYKVVIQDSDLFNSNQYPYVLQVYNVTS